MGHSNFQATWSTHFTTATVTVRPTSNRVSEWNNIRGPDKPLKVLVANLGKTLQMLDKNQVNGIMLVHPTVIVPTKIQTAEFSCVSNPKEGEEIKVAELTNEVLDTRQSRIWDEETDVSPDTGNRDTFKKLETLDLSHVPNSHCGKFRNMLKKFIPMWDNFFATTRTTENDIDLQPSTIPVAQHSYRAGFEAREEENSQIEKMYALASFGLSNHPGLHKWCLFRYQTGHGDSASTAAA